MNGLQGLFTYSGRLSRLGYIGYSILINIAGLPVRFASNLYSAAGKDMPAWVAFLSLGWILFLLWPISAVMVQRGHDRGRPAWFSIGLMIAVLIAIAVAGATLAAIPVAIALLLVGYQFIDYVCLPGVTSGKKYGPKDGLSDSSKPLVL